MTPIPPDARALTIRQPWASLIALGAKTIETRSWRTAYRGPLVIHAGKAPAPPGLHFAPLDPSRHLRTVIAERQVCIQRPGDFARPLPLGAVVAVADLVDVVPITTHADIGDPECIVAHGDGTLDHAIPSWAADQDPPPANVVRLDPVEVPDGAHLIRDVSDQEPYGDFTPGRYAWILDRIRPVTPVPTKGRQGLWRPDAGLIGLQATGEAL